MSEKKQVLIICHTAAGQMFFGVLMNRIWFSSVLASTPDEGVRLSRNDAFSLLLLDGDKVERGLQSAITLLKTDPVLGKLPLVVFITDGDSSLNQTLLDQGCAAVLTKPLDLAIMYGVLARLTGQPRSTARVTARIGVQVEVSEGSPGKTLTSVNISEGGLFLRTLDPLPAGTRLRVKFTLPHDTETIDLTAEVVRILSLGSQFDTEPGMAVHFIDTPEESLQKIRNFIQWEVTGDLEWKPSI